MSNVPSSRWIISSVRWREADNSIVAQKNCGVEGSVNHKSGEFIDLAFAAISLTSLVFIAILASIGAFFFIVGAIALLVLRLSQVGPAILRYWPLLILPMLAIFSTIWSDSPEVTMRAGLELMITCVSGIVLAKVLRIESAINFTFIPFFMICLISLPKSVEAAGENFSATGLFASKNALGFTAAMLITLAVAVLSMPGQKMWLRICAGIALLVSIYLGYRSHSVGAQFNIFISLSLYTIFYVTRRIGRKFRIFVYCFVTTAIVVLTSFALSLLGSSGRVLAVFGKDATLTGRTDLWRKAAVVGAESPIIGHGYSAFWRIGNLDAEQIWRKFGIAARSGFNFHNTLVDMYIDLGVVGVIVLAITCIFIGGMIFYRQILQPSWSNDVLMTLFLTVLIRHIAETGLIGPFSFYTVILVMLGVYSVSLGDRAPGQMQSKNQQFDRRRERPIFLTRSARWLD